MSIHIHRWVRSCCFVVMTCVMASVLSGGPLPVAAQSVNSAEIVVRFEDNRVVSRRVTFSEASISGLEALRRTGLALEETKGAVCRVDRTGCPATDCFCQASDPNLPFLYWSYYHWHNGQWQYASTGPAAYQVTNGAVEGWSWGEDAPTSSPVAATQAGVNWLRGKQQSNGSYTTIGATLDTLLAARAANANVAAWRSTDGKSLTDYLAAQAPNYGRLSVSQIGKLSLGLAAADLDPRSFITYDLAISLTAAYNPTTGAFGATNWDQAFGILGLAAAGETVPVTASATLAQRRNNDGGWGFSTGLNSDADSTGLMLQALVAGGEPITSTAVLSGVDYLRGLQNSDGGFPVDSAMAAELNAVPMPSNANSTALAVQGLVAAGIDPLGFAPTITGTTPITFLLSLQQPDGGFKWLTGDNESNLLATQQVIPALTGKAFPYRSRAVALRKSLDWIRTQQHDDGSFEGFDTSATSDAVLAIKAAGGDPLSFRSSTGKTPLDYLAANGPTYAAKGAAAAGKLALGVAAAGGNPRAIGGANLVISMTNTYNNANGAFGNTTYDQAYSILGLVAARQSVPVTATRYLATLASSGGGWGFGANDPTPDADTTGLALQALAAGGVAKDNQAVQDGLAFLHKVQNDDGGFPAGYDPTTNANSTALALQGLAAYGEDGRSLEWSVSDAGLTLRSPTDTLLALQQPAGGFPGYSGPNDPFATYQAVPGVAGVPFPQAIAFKVHLPVVIR